MTARRNEMIHLALDPDLVRAIDACAMAWGMYRSEAAAKLLSAGVAARRDELITALQDVAAQIGGPHG